MTERVAIVLVSHSQDLATGLRDVLLGMAPDVPIFAVGGIPSDSPSAHLGTSTGRVQETLAAAAASTPAGTVAFGDLGSAKMTVEAVLDSNPQLAGTYLIEAPFVEGALAAAVAAQMEETLEQVVNAAIGSVDLWVPRSGVDAVYGALDNDPGQASAQVTIAGAGGLHARPAAQVAKLAAQFPATVTIDGVDAASVLLVMSLGRGQGDTVTVAASGPGAGEAVAALVALLAADQ